MSLARNLTLGVLAAAFAASVAIAQTSLADAPAPPLGGASPLAAAPPPPQAREDLNQAVAAVVNDDIVSTYDLRQRMLLLLVTSGVQPTNENVAAIEKEAMRSLIDEHLELQEIRSVQKKQKDLHIEPTDKEIDAEIKDMAQQSGVPVSQLLATLKSAGVEAPTLRQQIAVQMAWRRYMGGRFGSSIRIGDEQVAAAEQRLLASAQKPQYLVSEIFIDASRVGGDQQAMEGARQLESQIKQGAPFPAVARQFSALPTAANGGDAGWLVSGDIQPVLETVLAAMRPGQLSPPVPTSTGVYLLLLRDKRAGAGSTLVNLKQAAIRLRPDATPDQVAQAQTKLEAVKRQFSGCSDFESVAAKVPGVAEGDLGETDLNELRPTFKQVVEAIKIGEVGGPVRTDAGLHLIALCGKRAAGARAPTRDDLENRLYGEQLSMVARRFLRDLRNSATIESR
jgi:peptidyl-prolyl cis-trans isomerase SurA